MKEEEPGTSVHKKLDQQLSSRTISSELPEADKIIADKDNVIERLRKENEDLLKEHSPTRLQGQNAALQQTQLESELSKRDALIKELKIQIHHPEELESAKSNNSNEASVCPPRNNGQYENHTIDFEMSFPFDDVQNHMRSIYNENKSLGKISFYGRLNLKTRKVVAASIESMTEDKDEVIANSNKDDKV
ncbi:MAG: hypothetical protein JO297_11465 [Nitrososphaeraceae archaeon]|nr:hypothetical protein [Nitrososphaeraceae archaeon]